MKRARRGLVVAWLTVSLLGVPGCAVDGLSFVQDERVSIVAPGDNDEVRLPLEVRWDVVGYDGLYAVFFDRSPMRPNRTLDSLVPDDDPCDSDPACPDAAWLADRGVYVTDRPSLRVDLLPDRRSTSRARDRHDLSIVLLDRAGRRVGESVFIREFFVERDR